MKRAACLILCLLIGAFLYSQKSDIGIYFGRFYSIYKYQDWGTGFRNQAGSQYNPYPSIVLNKQFSKKVSAELSASFMSYAQYTGTRLYSPGFYSNYNTGNISLLCGYSFLQSDKISGRIKGGVGLGLAPDQYEGSFVEMLRYPVVDSISRGSISRNFSPLFPTIAMGLDFSYKISNKIKFVIVGTYQKGIIKITEYDVYYNDGSGVNDQRAKQWGAGDFYGVQLGLRYTLKEKKK